MKLNKLFFYFFLNAILFACSENNEEGIKFLTVDSGKQTLNFSSETGYQSVTVSANVDFTVVSDTDWCKPTVLNYVTDNVRITVLKNETFEERSAKVTITADGVESTTIAVTQSGIMPVLIVSQKNIVIQTTEKQEFSLDINANIPIVFDLPVWISEKEENEWVSGLKKYSFNLVPLPANSTFREENITVRTANSLFDIQPVTVSVTQKEKIIPHTKIIAHRGFWNRPGSAQNSLHSLRGAIEIGAYGSELDVWITADGVVVLNHDPSYGGVHIETSNYSAIQGLRLSNGEPLPLLQQCIDIIKNQEKTKLIIEIKPHSTITNENRAVAAVHKLVNDGGVAHLVDYISFSENICLELIKADPQNRVAYLNGNRTPEQLKQAGYWGLDYHFDVLKNNQIWLTRARELGLTTNVWTVNSISDMLFFISLGVDFITTDNPVELKNLLE